MDEVTIEVTQDGPYLVTGPIELRDADGKVHPTKGKVGLCRCGTSTKKPFCDHGPALVMSFADRPQHNFGRNADPKRGQRLSSFGLLAECMNFS